MRRVAGLALVLAFGGACTALRPLDPIEPTQNRDAERAIDASNLARDASLQADGGVDASDLDAALAADSGIDAPLGDAFLPDAFVPDTSIPDANTLDSGSDAGPRCWDLYDSIVESAPTSYLRFEDRIDGIIPAAGAPGTDEARPTVPVTYGDGCLLGAQGVVGAAIDQVAAECQITIPSAGAALGSGDFSIEVWARLASVPGLASYAGLLAIDVGEGAGSFRGIRLLLRGATGGVANLILRTYPSEMEIVGGLLSTVRWHHVVAVRRGASASELWLDGAMVRSGSIVYDGWSAAASGRLGFGRGVRYQGRLDEASLYDHALSAEEILAHWLAGRPCAD